VEELARRIQVLLTQGLLVKTSTGVALGPAVAPEIQEPAARLAASLTAIKQRLLQEQRIARGYKNAKKRRQPPPSDAPP
jgi:hypothetical protein